jgi:hypothetical protein
VGGGAAMPDKRAKPKQTAVQTLTTGFMSVDLLVTPCDGIMP